MRQKGRALQENRCCRRPYEYGVVAGPLFRFWLCFRATERVYRWVGAWLHHFHRNLLPGRWNSRHACINKAVFEGLHKKKYKNSCQVATSTTPDNPIGAPQQFEQSRKGTAASNTGTIGNRALPYQCRLCAFMTSCFPLMLPPLPYLR